MIKNPRVRRNVSIGLLVLGGAVLFLTPENATFGLLLLAAGVVLEVIGIAVGHNKP